MKTIDIRALSSVELKAKESDLREEFFKLKFQHGIRQLEDTSKLKKIRKNIARIQTVINDKKLNA